MLMHLILKEKPGNSLLIRDLDIKPRILHSPMNPLKISRWRSQHIIKVSLHDKERQSVGKKVLKLSDWYRKDLGSLAI